MSDRFAIAKLRLVCAQREEAVKKAELETAKAQLYLAEVEAENLITGFSDRGRAACGFSSTSGAARGRSSSRAPPDSQRRRSVSRPRTTQLDYCTHGIECYDAKCPGIHPTGWDAESALKMAKTTICPRDGNCKNRVCPRLHPKQSKITCEYKTMCWNSNCKNLHPTGWNPVESLKKMKLLQATANVAQAEKEADKAVANLTTATGAGSQV